MVPIPSDEIEEDAVERRMLDRREMVYLREEMILLRKAVTILSPTVANIKGTLKVAIAFLIAGITVGLWIIQDTRSEVAYLEKASSIKHALIITDVRGNRSEQLRQDNAVARALNVVSINQKRVMRELKLPYMSPEKIEGLD